MASNWIFFFSLAFDLEQDIEYVLCSWNSHMNGRRPNALICPFPEAERELGYRRALFAICIYLGFATSAFGQTVFTVGNEAGMRTASGKRGSRRRRELQREHHFEPSRPLQVFGNYY